MDRFKRLSLIPLSLFAFVVFALLLFNGNRATDPANRPRDRVATAPRIESRPAAPWAAPAYILEAPETEPLTSAPIDLSRVLRDSLGEARAEMIPDPIADEPLARLIATPSSGSTQAPILRRSATDRSPPSDSAMTISLPPIKAAADRQRSALEVDRLPPVAPTRQPAITVDPTTSDPTKRDQPAASILTLPAVSRRNAPVRLSPVVLQQIRSQIDDGIVLVRKGALYSARNELFHALYLLAEARDAQSNQRTATQHLANAMTALQESDDFVRSRDSGAFFVDLDRTFNRHDTHVLKQHADREITPLEALQRYYEYAQEELIAASGNEPIAAEALFALGKLYAMPEGLGDDGEKLAGPKAIVLYQASVRINPRHARSANELAVLLAQHGEYATAKRLLLQSLRIEATAAGWHNLAWVHQRLGEPQLAHLATLEENATRQRNNPILSERPSITTRSVSFVPPEQFNGNRPAGAPHPLIDSNPADRQPAAPAETPWWQFWAE